MKRIKKNAYRLCALALSLLLAAALLPAMPALADGEDGIIHIASAEDLEEVARSCTLDSWSRGKTVVLDTDLTLESADYLPIPTFGGKFDGKGHTIRSLSLTDSLSPAGLFGVLQEGGSISDLNVEGSVTPEGDSEKVGGIVGENYGTVAGCTFTGTVSGKRSVGGIAGENAAAGVIRACTSSGAVFGENMTGGIAGCNSGSLLACRNGAYVNIESTDPAIDLENLDLSFSLDLAKLTQLDTANVATDTGGIAGYSSGLISECVNAAAVGYQHIGYNVGGVVGRSCGQIYACRSEAAVCGRKDVGGIAGQIEPYIRMEVSESLLQTLETQLDELSALVDRAADHAEDGSGEISSRLNSMSGYVDNAAEELNNVRVNADINTSITGNGAHSSGTQLGGGSSSTLDTTHQITGSGLSGSHRGSTSGGAAIDHNGVTGGELNGTTQIVAAPDLGGLTASINGLSSQVTMLNSAANSTVGTLTNDIRAINSKFNELSNTMLQAATNYGASDIISDTSSVDIDAVTLGKVSSCRNTGAVYGDINTGGIAGSMAVEYALDPEDDVTAHISGSYRRQYEYKAIVQKCVNSGEVLGKRSYAGGIAGRMDLGLITDCESYGAVTSENGSYVGGIAGVTGAVVRSSYAKCTLSGKKYVGGIVGSGVAEKASGSASSVAGCYALVEIAGCQQYRGAISGSDSGAFLENYYVSDDLAGINRQSYSGRAEPIRYDQLLAAEGLPDGMKQFTLRFVADGKTVLERKFSYGASFSEEDIPAPPEKDGCYVHWDKTDLTSLHYDTTVTAVYETYTPALTSVQQRDNGRNIFLIEGQYEDNASIRVAQQQTTPEAFGILTGSFGDRLSEYFSCLSDGSLPRMRVNREVLEQWSLSLADDGQEVHTVRYLSPTGKDGRLRIYVRENGGTWKSVDYGVTGSYLTFPVEGRSAEIAAVSTLTVGWFWLAGILVLLALILLIVLLARRGRRKKKARPATASAAPDVVAEADRIAQESAESSPAASGDILSAVSAPAVPAADAPQPAAPAAPSETDERLARVEEELRAMRAEREGGGARGKKRRRRFLPILITLLVLLAAAAVFFLHSGLSRDVEACLLLESRMKEDPLAMDVTVDASFGSLRIQTDASAVRTAAEGTAVTAVQTGGVTLYCADGSVYLENGKAYAIGGACPDYSALLMQTAALARTLEVTRSTDGTNKLYRLAASGHDAGSLVRLLVPDTLTDAAAIHTLEVELIAEGGELMALRFSSAGSSLALNARVDFRHSAAPEIPEDVLRAIRSGGGTDGTVLSADALRLLKACGDLLAREPLSADLALSADCGSIMLSDTVQYDRRTVDGQSIGCVRSGALSLYVSGSRVCDPEGNSIDAAGTKLIGSAQLISLCCELMMDGTADCIRSGSGYLYTLALDEEGMAALSAAIAPDIKAQSVSFTAGSIEVGITDEGTIRQILVSCTGALHLVLSDASASLSATITPLTREISFSQPALDALKQ